MATERRAGRMTFSEFLMRHRQVAGLFALVMASGGVGLLLNPPSASSASWVGLLLVALGGGVMCLVVWPKNRGPSEIRSSLASRFIGVLTLRGKFDALMPAAGVAIILADTLYNLLLSATPAVQTEDTIALLGASSLIVYGFVPSRFSRERDFVLVFFIILNAILVVPLLVARAYYADFERSVDLYSWVALAPQTSAVLTVLGIGNAIHPVAGATAPGLAFTPQHMSNPVTVVITTACSGIYSFGIFASAFIAFTLTEFERPVGRVWILLALGLLTSYVANILRMVVIVLVGYYTDTAETDLQNMLIAHSYAGWLIFLGWIALFWSLLLPFMLPRAPSKRDAGSAPKSARRESICGLCAGGLTPAVPATRCGCGRLYHRDCLEAAGYCPSCGRLANLGNKAAPGDS